VTLQQRCLAAYAGGGMHRHMPRNVSQAPLFLRIIAMIGSLGPVPS